MSDVQSRRPLRPKEGLARWAHRMLTEGKATSTQVTGQDASGRPIARNVVTANFAPRCEDPRHFGGEATTSPGNRLEVVMAAPCRRCAACLKAKRTMWAFRAAHENEKAPKTYFTTLTVNDVARHIIHCRAVARAVKADTETGELTPCWDEWTPHQQSWTFFLELGKEVTKYLKRLRKALHPTLKVRYSMYYEKGDQNDREHVHMLVHLYPTVPYAEVAWDDVWWAIRSKWKFFDLVPGVPLGLTDESQIGHAGKSAWYVASYLQDDSHNRARASLRYGPPRVRPIAGLPPHAGSLTPSEVSKKLPFVHKEMGGDVTK